MNDNKYFIIVQLLLSSFCLCEISEVQKEKLLNGFLDYYNKLPNQVYQCDEGSLQSMQQLDETTYQIVTNIKVTKIYKTELTKLLKCTATVQDSDNYVTVTNMHCEDPEQQSPAETGSHEKALEGRAEVTEPTVERKLVQHDTPITSGERFITIPRNQPSAPCIGCSLHVNPQAAGVRDLAALGVQHLDIHEPSVKHSLGSVIDVERQVQVVNGIRYILTLSINSNSCTEVWSENCASSKICKITILVKPWIKLPNDGNRRTILANNCTEEWQYGDNGEVLFGLSTHNSIHNQGTSVYSDDFKATDDDVQVKHNQERSFTDQEIKNLQDQIISNIQFQETTVPYRKSFTSSRRRRDVSKQYVLKEESSKHSVNASIESEKEQQFFYVNLDKKKTIDNNKFGENLSRITQVSDARVRRRLLGGETERDPTEARYKALADESLRRYTVDYEITQPFVVLCIQKVTTKVVAGLLTKIDFLATDCQDSKTIQCHSEVWDRPWLNNKEITVNCNNE